MDRSSRRHDSAEAMTTLILEVFRLNGRLLLAGDRLIAGLGLTSARWQVMGAIALSPAPEPVARLARNMGLNRQGVQRIVNELVEDGIAALRDNPHHRRAKLVVLTEAGRRAYDAAGKLQAPWARALAEGLDPGAILRTARLLEKLRVRLEKDLNDEAQEHD
jgi:DNA-binding MarR family transcriptional regulator